MAVRCENERAVDLETRGRDAIAGIDILADPMRIRRLGLAFLND